MNAERIVVVKKKKLLDSFALLAYLNKGPGYEVVKEALLDGQTSGAPLLMNEMNVGETYYILARKKNTDGAEYFLDTILAGLPIEIISNDFDRVIAAARIKAQYPLSFSDCFAVATAVRVDATILTGDPEFKKVERLARIEWLR
jgi:uncharacterized protein